MREKARISVPLLLLLGLVSCVPWTVRPIDSNKEATEEASAEFSATSYVDGIWDTELSAAVSSSAVDARELLAAMQASPADAIRRHGHQHANGPVYFIVQGKGTVTSVDTRSRVGLALVDVEPLDGKPDVSIQIGPVLRGTSLRDATGIVSFSEFVNQLQYADVGNEMNQRVLTAVLAPIDASTLKGKEVSFTGTLLADAKSSLPLADLVPTRLSVMEGH